MLEGIEPKTQFMVNHERNQIQTSAYQSNVCAADAFFQNAPT